jgi:hypothetical protein
MKAFKLPQIPLGLPCPFLLFAFGWLPFTKKNCLVVKVVISIERGKLDRTKGKRLEKRRSMARREKKKKGSPILLSQHSSLPLCLVSSPFGNADDVLLYSTDIGGIVTVSNRCPVFFFSRSCHIFSCFESLLLLRACRPTIVCLPRRRSLPAASCRSKCLQHPSFARAMRCRFRCLFRRRRRHCRRFHFRCCQAW